MSSPIKVFIKLRNPNIKIPEYATKLASGVDVCADIPYGLLLEPSKIAIVPTGIYVEIPEGYEIQVRSRSGLAIKHGITVINSPGTIDADYRGEIKIGLINLNHQPYWISPNEKVAQLVLCPVYMAQFEIVNELSETNRGENGFGHTGTLYNQTKKGEVR